MNEPKFDEAIFYEGVESTLSQNNFVSVIFTKRERLTPQLGLAKR